MRQAVSLPGDFESAIKETQAGSLAIGMPISDVMQALAG